ncbi:MAG: creatininase family protein [Rhodospirillaceae bacterium]|nr:creatininase family protein [Rhodospirillaceae bacterium]
MRKILFASVALALALSTMNTPRVLAAAAPKEALVEFEMMTWPEVKAALAAGKTTALVYTGGTEQRGPQAVNGGHTLKGREISKAIALELGNAISMPVLPYTPNNASADLPGTIGLTPDLLGALLERITEQTIANGFKNVVLMGDHGGGQGDLGPKNVYDTVAKKLDAKYAAKGIHVYYCDEVYKPATFEFDRITHEKGYPLGTHASLSDTSQMMYLEKGRNWIRRDLVPKAIGTPLDDNRKPIGPDPHNGIQGDASRSTEELGKMFFDMQIAYAVKQIRGFIPAKAGN